MHFFDIDYKRWEMPKRETREVKLKSTMKVNNTKPDSKNAWDPRSPWHARFEEEYRGQEGTAENISAPFPFSNP